MAETKYNPLTVEGSHVIDAQGESIDVTSLE